MSPCHQLHSTIDRVTAHPSGAHVVRVAELSPDLYPWSEGGRHTLRLPDLPLLMRSGTLRARIDGDGLRLLRFDEVADLLVGTQRDENGENAAQEVTLESLEAEVRGAERQLRRLRLRGRVQEQLIRQLSQRDADFDAEALTELPDAPSLGAVADAREDVLEGLEDALVAGRAAVRQAERALALAKKKRDNARSGGRVRALRCLELEVEVDRTDASGQLVIDYFVDGVRWSPGYVLELDGAQAVLSMQAQVAQATGETWRHARLSVSTASVRRTTRLPEQQAWRIGRSQPAVSTGWRPLPSDLPTLYSGLDSAGRAPKKGSPAGARRSRHLLSSVEAATRDAEDQLDALEASAQVHIMGGAMAMEDFDDDLPEPEMAAPLPPPSAPMPASMPAPAAMMAGAPPPAPKRRMARGRGQARKPAPPGAPPPPPRQGPPPDPSALLDYGWLRLPHWTDRSRRGGLRPVTLDSALKAFVEERGLGPGAVSGVAQALRNLRNRQQRLSQVRLPEGCIDSASAGFHHTTPPGPRVTVPSDSRFRGIQVASGTAAVRRVYRVVPRQDTVVQAMIEFDNPTGMPLGSGPLRVLEGGGMRTRSQLLSTPRGGLIRLSLGPEDRVRVARNARVSEETRGMLGGDRALIHEVEVTVANRLAHPVAVEVFEALPDDTADAGVEVHFDGAEPRAGVGAGPHGQPNDRALGWRIEVSAGQERTIRWGYTITISSRAELEGGNRREP